MVIPPQLPQSKPNGYLARSCKIPARSCNTMHQLTDILARSCKIALVLLESITIRLPRILRDNHLNCNNLVR